MPQAVAAGRMTSSETFRSVEEDDSTANKKRDVFYDVYGPEVHFLIFIFLFNVSFSSFLNFLFRRMFSFRSSLVCYVRAFIKKRKKKCGFNHVYD